MNIDQLVYFLHIAETGSINATAQKFYMTQQAVSASIKKMENELEVQLIFRHNKGVALTPQGYIFAEHAKELARRYDVALQDLTRFKTEEQHLQGTLTVFSASIFTHHFLPEVISSFKQVYPDTHIQIIDIEGQNLIPYVLEGYCDVALAQLT